MRRLVSLLALLPGLAQAQAPTGIRAIDWANRTYGEGEQAMKLVNGEWERTQEDESYTESMRLVGVAYGDVNKDGVEDAVVHTAYNGGGTGTFDSVDIYTPGKAGPAKIGQLPGGDRGDGGVDAVKFDGGALLLTRRGSLAVDGACCPSLTIQERWTWAPGGPVLDAEAQRVSVDATPSGDYAALRKAGLAALATDATQAAGTLRDALALHPTDAVALQELGLALMKSREWVAVPVLYHALAISPDKAKPSILYNLGMVCIELDRPADAVKALEKSLALRPGNAPTEAALARAKAKLAAAGSGPPKY
ncbi:MAG: tetratricopeptide repeat protein [bacterium]